MAGVLSCLIAELDLEIMMATVTYKNQPAIDKTKGKIPLAGNSHVYRVKKDCGMIA